MSEAIEPTVETDIAPALRAEAPALVTGGLTEAQFELAKRTVAPGLTNDEFEVFKHVCRHKGLDPLEKQIYAIKRFDKRTQKEKMSIQTGIDGFRLIADRTGKYAGTDPTVFSGRPKADEFMAVVTVYKIVAGLRCAFTGEARWSEYCPASGQDMMWQKMPHTMLEKCAEAKALRRAFPADLSGIYTTEEMDQADHPRQVQVVDTPKVEPRRDMRKPLSEEAKAASQEIVDATDAGMVVPDGVHVANDSQPEDKLAMVSTVYGPKTGSTPGKGPWTKYGFVLNHGGKDVTVGSFDKAHYATALFAFQNELAVMANWKPSKNPKFTDLTYLGIEPGAMMNWIGEKDNAELGEEKKDDNLPF